MFTEFMSHRFRILIKVWILGVDKLKRCFCSSAYVNSILFACVSGLGLLINQFLQRGGKNKWHDFLNLETSRGYG